MLLIHSLVSQLTVLIAQLATSSGLRAPVSSVANQVFLDLARELEAQGVSKRVSADMFGITLRSYRRKIQRLQAANSVPGRSLWSVVLDRVSEGGAVTRAELLQSLSRDDRDAVLSVVSDLCGSGLVFRSGRGDHTVYRAATDEDVTARARFREPGAEDELLWALVYRHGPLDLSELQQRTQWSEARLRERLSVLAASGRVCVEADPDRYSASELVIPLSSGSGWEAAIYDHIHAVVRAVGARLNDDPETEPFQPYTGGSTYTYDVWPGHPHAQEAYESLLAFRKRCDALERKIRSYNAATEPPGQIDRVTAYAGEVVLPRERDPEG